MIVTGLQRATSDYVQSERRADAGHDATNPGPHGPATCGRAGYDEDNLNYLGKRTPGLVVPLRQDPDVQCLQRLHGRPRRRAALTCCDLMPYDRRRRRRAGDAGTGQSAKLRGLRRRGGSRIRSTTTARSGVIESGAESGAGVKARPAMAHGPRTTRAVTPTACNDAATGWCPRSGSQAPGHLTPSTLSDSGAAAGKVQLSGQSRWFCRDRNRWHDRLNVRRQIGFQRPHPHRLLRQARSRTAATPHAYLRIAPWSKFLSISGSGPKAQGAASPRSW
jgi:hypothetical protein